MARTPVLAAGGIVLRREKNPRIAVVRLRKRNEWVLPKGKLDDGETPRAAAEREVLEETGHDVSVHEFLGTLVYESGGGFKVVHYWRMQADGEPAHELMHDIKEVDWLPLDAALARLSRGYERAFLANVGPIALQAAATAETARRSRAKAAAPEKRRSRRAAPAPTPTIAPPPAPAATPSIAQEMPLAAPPEVVEASPEVAEVVQDQGVPVDSTMVETGVPEIEAVESEIVESEAAESEPSEAAAPAYSEDFRMVPQSTEQLPDTAADVPAEAEASDSADSRTERTDQGERVSLVRKVRDWLTRAA
jgi:8-oxo-dGTP diphosphatase